MLIVRILCTGQCSFFWLMRRDSVKIQITHIQSYCDVSVTTHSFVHTRWELECSQFRAFQFGDCSFTLLHLSPSICGEEAAVISKWHSLFYLLLSTGKRFSRERYILFCLNLQSTLLFPCCIHCAFLLAAYLFYMVLCALFFSYLIPTFSLSHYLDSLY